MESHHRFCCRKWGEAPKPKPRLVYTIHKYRYIWLCVCINVWWLMVPIKAHCSASHPSCTAGLSIQLKSMFGLASVWKAESVSLMVSWRSSTWNLGWDVILPFLHDKFGDSNYCFMQDNDPKHVARLTWAWLQENEVNWWQTPPESPDINPIENLWHKLKEYVHPTRSQATHKGWTCGSHNSFLEYSGCYKM